MTADNIKTCVLDMGAVINVVFRSTSLNLGAQALTWWLNLVCANKGLQYFLLFFFWHFSMLRSISKMSVESAPASADVGTEYAA